MEGGGVAMCSMYWTLDKVQFTCPNCGAKTEDDLQTHFMGEVMSCLNHYRLREPVPELRGATLTLVPPIPDYFEAECGECEKYIDMGARIVKGRVWRVWPIGLAEWQSA